MGSARPAKSAREGLAQNNLVPGLWSRFDHSPAFDWFRNHAVVGEVWDGWAHAQDAGTLYDVVPRRIRPVRSPGFNEALQARHWYNLHTTVNDGGGQVIFGPVDESKASAGLVAIP